ncbi:SDR family oxidoreductase [Flavobacterium sp.]|uniref:SDR family NAD(P)-dependent oxidoreductase n=1 Tax=Flavobacterium sp. TaxID=239 RepID=UPI00263541F5|nr:SDR family oxidoreductase [Flavobacterium sp.]
MNILITGGASGLGEAITRNFAKDSSNKVYFTFNASDEKAKAIENDFPNAAGLRCNFKNAEDVVSLQSKLSELNLDVLINNAYSGEPIKTYFHKIDADVFATEFQDNLIPTIKITQAAIASFRKKKSGKIITVLTSFLLNTPPTGSAVYLANKAYLASLVKTWATENGKYNITSNSISPSFMLSGLTKDVDERVIEQMVENHPLKKLLTLQETADTVLFMASATSHMNGLDIVLNAGTNLR